jgi:tetratricopeptide (TPR) repeat protein
MQSTRRLQLIIIALTIGLIAFIYFFGRNNPTALFPGSSGDEDGYVADSPIESALDRGTTAGKDPLRAYVEQEKEKLGSGSQETLKRLKDQLKDPEPDTVSFYQKAGDLFSKERKYIASGYYYEKAAYILDTEETWMNAANRFFEAQKTAPDTHLFNALVRRSIAAYEKVLEHNPGNLDARAELAVSLFESEQDPMKGVGMLVEINQANPEHEKTLYYLGMINLRSGNYERARDRMEELSAIQPDKPFTYYYLGQIYLNLGEKEKALEALKEYRRLVQSPQFRERATEMINRIEEQL